ncbi:major facilitator superfamily domain-containing protein [Camillea tinctor]|nr:major facilitator superfamily domain-containing protein [Camillea tinctor]
MNPVHHLSGSAPGGTNDDLLSKDFEKSGTNESSWTFRELDVDPGPRAANPRDASTNSSDLEKQSQENPRAHIFLTRPMTTLHEIAFFMIVATANFTPLSGFHQTLCILHIIGDDLGVTNPGQLVWLMSGYGLTVGTFILPAGRLGDVYGYKRVFVLGNLWFAAFSLLAGLATYAGSGRGYAVFLVSRIMQGVGPALLIPNAVALLGVTYVPGPRKAMLFALFGAVAPASAVISPAVTSLFAMVWWPSAFWALALVLVVVALAAVHIVPDVPPSPEKTAAQQQQQPQESGFRRFCAELDVLGAVTGVTGLVLISVAWNQGVVDGGWHSAYTYVLLILGILLCASFACVERRARKPLIPLQALRNPGVAFVLAAVSCGWGCFGIYIYYVWEFYEVARGASPLLATAWHSPILVSGVAAAVTTGLAIHRVGPAAVMALALLAFTAGTALIATAPVDQTYWAQTFLCNVVVTWGMDLSFPAATLVLSDLVAPEHQGIAASLVTTVVNYSGALALGVAGTVEIRVNNGGATPEDVLRGYRGAWYVAIALGALGLAISLVFAWRFSRWQRAAAAA